MRQHTRNRSRWWRAAALTSSLALVAAACGDDSDDGDTETDDVDDTEEEAAVEANCPDTGDTIEIGWIAWDEDIAVTHLWDALLTEQGYEVEQTQLEVGPIYAGLGQGDFHLFLDAWLPDTHGSYWEEEGDNVEDLGVWNDSATLHLTVPDYVDITSIDELADNADEFDSEIVGIEAGAGLMEATLENVIPDYGLDDWNLIEGSTPGMLEELSTAIDNEEPIVVTLWRPHWAYDAFEIHDLEDPEGSLGTGENINALACQGFSEVYPEVADWIGNFFLDSDQLNGLTNLVIEEYGEGQEGEAIEEWLSDDENRALADSWISGDAAPADDAEADEADDTDDADAEADDADAEADDMDDADAADDVDDDEEM
jgi:glycine betaine/proline transport system substrate-binding protein